MEGDQMTGFRLDVTTKHTQWERVKWRCSHGHRWESYVRTSMFEIHWGDIVSPPIDLESACPYCFVELLREKCGTVRKEE